MGADPEHVTQATSDMDGDAEFPGDGQQAVLAALWLANPVDLIPEFVPIIGPLDDVVVVALTLRYAARQVLLDAWPGETRLLERLLGPART